MDTLVALLNSHHYLAAATIVVGYLLRILQKDSKFPISIDPKYQPAVLLGLGQVYAILIAKGDGLGWVTAIEHGLTLSGIVIVLKTLLTPEPAWLKKLSGVIVFGPPGGTTPPAPPPPPPGAPPPSSPTTKENPPMPPQNAVAPDQHSFSLASTFKLLRPWATTIAVCLAFFLGSHSGTGAPQPQKSDVVQASGCNPNTVGPLLQPTIPADVQLGFCVYNIIETDKGQPWTKITSDALACGPDVQAIINILDSEVVAQNVKGALPHAAANAALLEIHTTAKLPPPTKFLFPIHPAPAPVPAPPAVTSAPAPAPPPPWTPAPAPAAPSAKDGGK